MRVFGGIRELLRSEVTYFTYIDGFNVWSAAYLGDLFLIAGTVIRSGDCALSSASPVVFEP